MTIKSIMSRKSVRNYTDEPLNDAEIEKLRVYIHEVSESEGIWGNKVRLQLIENGNGNEKLGTYSVIRGAHSFMAAACKKGAHDMEDIGYQFEKLILFATELGLGTVILGGTFSRGGFYKAMCLQSNEVLPVVSPVGYEGGEKSFLGRIIKSNARNRKQWSDLFFDGNFTKPLTPADEFAEVLEAVRQAPSARNMQPWRIVKESGNVFHFYSAGKMYMNRIDMGIALCHFELAVIEKGISGSFQIHKKPCFGEFKYLISWVSE